MIWLVLLLAQTAAPGDQVSRGAATFARTCAIGYCHGTGGAAGRAPRIQGRTLTHDHLLKVVRDGIPGTAMPAWKGKLSDEDIASVVAYMMSIASPGPSGPVVSTPQPAAPAAVRSERKMPPEMKRGRDLFFDATRGTRCGTCHALENWGIAVGPNLAAAPPKAVSDIRGARAPGVGTARLTSGEKFPAILLGSKDTVVRLYDLTSPPPVLRTLPSAEVSFSRERDWSHSAAISAYSDAELGDIVAYIGWLGSR